MLNRLYRAKASAATVISAVDFCVWVQSWQQCIHALPAQWSNGLTTCTPPRGVMAEMAINSTDCSHCITLCGCGRGEGKTFDMSGCR
jgi:hypothetical protein